MVGPTASRASPVYEHYFDDLFRKQAHIRSGEVEELLGMLADPFSGVSLNESMLTNADFQFKPARSSTGEDLVMSQSTYDGLIHSPDREVRRTAFESLTDEYLAHKNTLANNLATSIKQNVFKMRARRHDSTLAATLFEDNIPVEVFHNLIGVFRRNLPTWQRYWAIKRKALGVDRLHYYDIWAPIATQRPAVPYEQAVEWICAGLAPLGDEYVQTVRRGCLDDRWVDVYPNQGKVAGAFSSGAPGTHPFIMIELPRRSVQPQHAGARASAIPCTPISPSRISRWSTATTRCLWPRSHRISIRPWCGRICSRPIPIRSSN